MSSLTRTVGSRRRLEVRTLPGGTGAAGSAFGSTGFGRAHFRAGWKQWGRAMQDDVADATKWAVSKGIADGAKVCIAGASYGGYSTLMGLIRHGELYRCGVAWIAVTDPRLMFEYNRASDQPEEVRQYRLPILIGDPKADAAMLAEVAPVEQAAKIKAPLLLAFGGRDRRVPLEHGRRMREATDTVEYGTNPRNVILTRSLTASLGRCTSEL